MTIKRTSARLNVLQVKQGRMWQALIVSLRRKGTKLTYADLHHL